MFDKTAAIEKRRKVVTRDKMVLDAIDFPWAWGTGCVWGSGYGNTDEEKRSRTDAKR
jgi:hypothetical protein